MIPKLKSLLDTPHTDDRILKKKFKTCKIKSKGNDLDFIKGRFSTIEVDQIDKALEEYLKEKNFSRESLNSLIHSKKSKQKVKGFFRDILERSHVNRSVDQLYFYMARKYSEITAKYEPWTREEDEQLLKLVEFKGRKWKEISLELNRKDVKVRYEKISRKSSGFSSGSWSQEETFKFMQGKKMLQEKYKISNPTEFNHWTELSLLVGTKSFIQCRTKYIHSTFNVVHGYKVKWTLEDDTILLERLRGFCSQAKDESEIIWNRIASNEWVPWTGACLQRRWHKLKTRCSRSFNSFIDQLNYISGNLRLLSRTKYMNRDLLTFYSNQSNGVWNLEQSREFLSHILTLFSDATCEDEVDWGSLRFSSWDGPFLRKKWFQIKQQLKPRESLAFIDAVAFCKENLQNFKNDDDFLERSSLEEQEKLSFEPPRFQSDAIVEQENEQSHEASKRVEKRKDLSLKKKKSRNLKSSQVIDDNSGEGQSLRKHKKAKKKKFKSAKQIQNSSDDE